MGIGLGKSMQLVKLGLEIKLGIKVGQIGSKMSSVEKKSCWGIEINWLVIALVFVS